MLGIILANYFAIIVNRRWKPRRLRDSPPDSWKHPDGRKVVMGASAIVIVALVVAGLPNAQGTTNFSRNRVVSIAMDSAAKKLDAKPKGFVQPTRSDIPDQTSLVPTASTRKYNVVQIVLESQSWKSTTLGTPSLDTWHMDSRRFGRN